MAALEAGRTVGSTAHGPEPEDHSGLDPHRSLPSPGEALEAVAPNLPNPPVTNSLSYKQYLLSWAAFTYSELLHHTMGEDSLFRHQNSFVLLLIG